MTILKSVPGEHGAARKPVDQHVRETARAGLDQRTSSLCEYASRYARKIQRGSVSDAVFIGAVSEVTGIHGVHKDAIAERTGASPASVYRWASGKSMPQPLMTAAIVQQLIALARDEADRAVSESLFNGTFERHENVLRAGSCVSFDTNGPRFEVNSCQLKIWPVSGQSLTTADKNLRATFAAFNWKCVPGEGVRITPPLAAAQAHLIVSSYGVEYFDHSLDKFVEAELGAGGIADIAFFAADRENPVLPEILIRSKNGGQCCGRLLLSSATGVPYVLSGDSVDFYQAVQTQPSPVVAKVVAVSLADFDNPFSGLERFTSGGSTGDQYKDYEHRQALDSENFEIWNDRLLYNEQWSYRNQGNRKLCSMMNRFVFFDKEKSRPVAQSTFVSVHSGQEIIIPLYGLMNAFIIDAAQYSTASGGAEAVGETRLSDVDAAGLDVPPIVFGAMELKTESAVGGSSSVLVVDPIQSMHGFTALSRRAAMLCISVQALSMESGWRARSVSAPSHASEVA